MIDSRSRSIMEDFGGVYLLLAVSQIILIFGDSSKRSNYK